MELNFEYWMTVVQDWADSKDLLYPKNADKQFMKFMEEVFEFKTEMDIFDYDYEIESIWDEKYHFTHYHEIQMEMGDIFVTLIILCEQLGINPVKCLEMAYKKIENRKGRVINGTFVKEEDLE